MNLCELLLGHARDRPDAPAIIEPLSRAGHAAITFGQLEDRTARAASLLRERGLRPGSRVLLLVPLSIELYTALLAVLRIGAVAVVLDPSAGRAHIARSCELARPDALIASPRAHLLRLLVPALRRIPALFTTGPLPLGAARWSRHRSLTPWNHVEPVGPDHHALLTFTSGSTGEPKGAIRTHAILLAQHAALEPILHGEPGGSSLVTLGVFTLSNLASGVCSILAAADLRRPAEIDPHPVVEQLQRHAVSSIVASPALLRQLAGARPNTMSLPALRRLITGGAPVFPDDLDALAAAFPDAEPTVLFGSTEAEPIAHLPRRFLHQNDLARIREGGGLPVGRIARPAEVRIIGDHWGTPLGPLTPEQLDRLTLPPGADEPGEIIVTGPHVVREYVNAVGEAETKIRVDGVVWHRTGDAGRLGTDGHLWLLGRCSAKVQDHHGIIYPLSAEAAARAVAPGTAVAFVALGGERALVLERTTATPAVAQRLREALAWAHVDRVVMVPRLPMDVRHQAKIDYPRLHRLLASWHGVPPPDAS